jgi:hypothetical protein
MSDNITNSINIPNGPFKGVQALPNELQMAERRGEMVPIWGVHARTRWFLDQFPPAEGWRVEVKVMDAGIKMYDNYTRDANDNASIQPTREFTASLLNKDGLVVASGSVLRIINSEGAWKGGISSARGALYEALGLPDSLVGNTEEDDRSKKLDVTIREVALPTQQSATNAGSEEPAPAVSMEGIQKVEDLGSEPLDTVDAKSDAPAATTSEEATSAAEATQAESESAQQFKLDGAPEAKVEPKAKPTKQDRQQRAMDQVQAQHPNGIPPSLLRQIKIIAQQQKKQVPDFANIDEATAFLASLRLPTAGNTQQSGGVL